MISWRLFAQLTLLVLTLATGNAVRADETPVLVKNIYTGRASLGIEPDLRVTLGNKVLFSRENDNGESELWISDGTAAGTRLVKALSDIREMVASGNRVFFVAAHEYQPALWVTDGTEAGTRFVVDLTTELDTSPVALRALGNGIVFISDSDDQPAALWYSDGTANGTRLLKVVAPEGYATVSDFEYVTWQTVGGVYYFIVLNLEIGAPELWRTSGTPASTSKVVSFSPDLPDYGTLLGGIGSTLYFSLPTPEGEFELWKSNGSAKGTVKVKTLAAAPLRDTFVQVGTRGYFVTRQLSQAEEIWFTDGTAAGTKPLSEETVLPAQEVGEEPVELTFYYPCAVNGELVVFYSPLNGPLSTPSGLSVGGIWTYPGPGSAGRDVYVCGPGESVPEMLSNGTDLYFTLYRLGETRLHAYRPGTGLREVKTAFYGGAENPHGSLSDLGLKAAGSRLFFSAQTPEAGKELWTSDGTEAGTVMVQDFTLQDYGSSPSGLLRVGSRLYFTALDREHGSELWSSDGTEAGTTLIKDIDPRTSETSSNPAGLTELNGIVYFSANDSTHGYELWRTDGTEAGTVMVKDINIGASSSNPSQFFAFKDKLYFTASTLATGQELWVTDGTEAGTVLLANLSSDSPTVRNSSLSEFVQMDGWLYFICRTGSNPETRLYRTDGLSGTVIQVGTGLGSGVTFSQLRVRPPTPGAAAYPDQSVLFFSVQSDVTHELYRCLNEEEPELLHSNEYQPFGLFVSGRRVILDNYYPEGTSDILISDGTPGTPEGLTTSSPALVLAVVGDLLYYQEDTAEALRDLRCIRLDGAGDQLLRAAQYEDESMEFIHREGGTLFFSTSSSQLWQTAGTAASTQRVGSVTIDPSTRLQRLGDRLYFAGDDGVHGMELQALPMTSRLQVDQVLADGSLLPLASGATVNLGAQLLGESRTLTLRLTSAGLADVTGTALTAPALGDFTVNPTTIPGTLTAGTTTDVQITFTPQAAGASSSSLQISGTAGSPFIHEIRLAGEGIAPGGLPRVTGMLPSRLVLAGQPVLFQAEVTSSAPLTGYQWKRGSVKVGDTLLLSLPAVQLTQAGSYTLTATSSLGSGTSPVSHLAVVNPAPAAQAAPLNKALTLTSKASAPKGCTLSYEWRRNGTPVTAATKASLTIPKLTEALTGEYECLVTLKAPDRTLSLSHGITRVTLLTKPEIEPMADQTSWIGGTETVQVITATPATKFSAKGLPSGLKISATGLISGRPTKCLAIDPDTGYPQPYRVTLTASNAAGSSEPVSFDWYVNALLPPGTYEGLLDRNPDADEGKNLGSRVTLTFTTTGALSGRLLHGGKTYAFTSTAAQPVTNENGVQALITVSRGRDLPPVQISFISFGTYLPDPPLNLLIEDQVVTTGILRQQIFSSKEPATDYAGYYTLSLDHVFTTEEDARIPQGSGYMTATVSKTGIITWKGKLADGTAVTGSSGLCMNFPVSLPPEPGTVVFHIQQDLYKATGSIHGQGVFEGTVPISIIGVLSWEKAPQTNGKERNYKDGITLHYPSLSGQQYTPPDTESTDFLGLSLDESAATWDIIGDTVPGTGLSQNFTVNLKGQVKLPPLSANDPENFLKSLSFSPKTGLVKGSFVLRDENLDAPTKPYLRTVNFEGAALSGGGFHGFFLLPDLPDAGPPATTLSTSPLRSGFVNIF